MNPYLMSSRLIIIIFSVILSFVVTGIVLITVQDTPLQLMQLSQTFSLIASCYLYLTLLAGPLCFTFPSFAWRSTYLYARRALGISTWYFAILHASIAFFGQFNGFAGLKFLNEKYLMAMFYGLFALIILTLLMLSSNDFIVKKFTFRYWKILHRSVYFAGLCILLHAQLLGVHLNNFSNNISIFFFIAISFLLLLETQRVDIFLSRYFSIPTYGFSFPLVTCVILFMLYNILTHF